MNMHPKPVANDITRSHSNESEGRPAFTALQPSTSAMSAEAPIQALFQQLLLAWNRGDGTAYGELFTEDADYITFDGTHVKGREDIARSHQQLFDTHLKGSRLVGRVKDVRFLSPTVALVHATGGTIMAGKSTPSAERDSIQTLVAIQREGEWLFTAFHNNRQRPIMSSTGGLVIWLLSDQLWKWFGPKQG